MAAETKAKKQSKVAKKVTKKEKEKQTLVIVESPGKVKTIEKYLGSSYNVRHLWGI